MLKRLKVKMASAPTTQVGGIPVICIDGELIKHYNDADQQVKDGERFMKDMRGEIIQAGLEPIYQRSLADPVHPTPTVKLQDDTGAALQVQFVNKYSAVTDIEAVNHLFADAKVDINVYMQELVVGKFDCGVFLDGEGRFQQKVYDQFRKALEGVATALGVACPLETTKVIKPLPAMHEQRWALFPDVEAQALFTQLCPNSIAIKPDRPKSGTL